MVLFKTADGTYVDPNGKPASEEQVQEFLDLLSAEESNDLEPPDVLGQLADAEARLDELETENTKLAKFLRDAGLPVGTGSDVDDVIEHINATAALVSSQQAQIVAFEDHKKALEQEKNQLETKNKALSDFVHNLMDIAKLEDPDQLPAIFAAALTLPTLEELEKLPKVSKDAAKAVLEFLAKGA